MDYHTVGGGYPEAQTVINAKGGRWGNALIFEDWYLADAAFTIAVTGPTHLLDQTETALRNPVYPPHLGRRACQPDTPLLLTTTPHAEAALEHLPLHRDPPPRPGHRHRHLHQRTTPHPTTPPPPAHPPHPGRATPRTHLHHPAPVGNPPHPPRRPLR
ncbi:hypothetical protein GCM10020000_84610 [Streptomyces olivoverticillatus]